FLAGRIPLTASPVMIEDVMKSTERRDVPDLEGVLRTDLQARATAREWLACNIRQNTGQPGRPASSLSAGQ
ncbi:MAG: 1-deoxy-D-xylulose-5-phosphate reductoisomerase, partial [Nitrosomonas sp.]|nr:1-deoxy-D-xylulose-5-phosphate reductoisomerase [Nitrosomonas sp.]